MTSSRGSAANSKARQRCCRASAVAASARYSAFSAKSGSGLPRAYAAALDHTYSQGKPTIPASTGLRSM